MSFSFSLSGCNSCNFIMKYILLFFLSSSNILTYIYMHPIILLFNSNNKPDTSIVNALLFTIYDVSRLSFSFLWNIITIYITINHTISISLFLLAILNFCFALEFSYNIPFIFLILTRSLIGFSNNLHSSYTLALSDMFSYGDSRNIFELSSILNNLTCIAMFTFGIFITESFHFVLYGIAILNGISFIAFTIQARITSKEKVNRYIYQSNENEYQSKDRINNTQSNSLYQSNYKIRNQNIDVYHNNNNNIILTGNLNSNSGNVNKSKSIDSALSKNFKQLNSESIDNNNPNNNNHIIKVVNTNNSINNNNNEKRPATTATNSNKTGTIVNNVNSSSNNFMGTIPNLKYNFSHNRKKHISTIISIHQGTGISSPSGKNIYFSGNYETNLNNSKKLTNSNTTVNKKNIWIIILYSLIQFNYNFSLFVFLMMKEKKEKINIFFGVYYLFQILFSPLNKKMISISLKSPKNKRNIFKFSFVISIVLSIMFNLFYLNTIHLKSFQIFLIFFSFLSRNEAMTIMLAYCNINIFVESGAEKSMKQKKNISGLISTILTLVISILFFQLSPLGPYIILYGVIPFFLIISFIIGICFI